MDTSDKDIFFDKDGICNHCYRYDQIVRPLILKPEEKAKKLELIIDEIKTAGKGRRYDCIIGISGGLDSSYVAYLAWKHGLRAILVHFDNGWDSELAVKNIENIVTKTGFDYFNYIVDWEEFRDLQLAYFKASVVDVEVPTDQGICNLIPKLVCKFGVKYNLFGINYETESTMGKSWNFPFKMDRGNLEAIHKKFGTRPLKTFPYLSPWEEFLYQRKKVNFVNILQYAECDYGFIRDKLSNQFGWKDYGVKHGESIFTKFYQSYYLPKKFGFDKRRAHLSDQINSGHITREYALHQLSLPVYKDKLEEQNEVIYVANKFSMTFEEIIGFVNAPNVPQEDYGVNMAYGSYWDKIIKRFIIGVRNLRQKFRRKWF
jgi:N-acetyl sugar amidotransferase